MRREEKDIKWVEVRIGTTVSKRILIEDLHNGDCFYIGITNQDSYIHYGDYKVTRCSKGNWEHIKNQLSDLIRN